MSADDISRLLFDPRMHYATALMQQGRVLTDADWNEMVMLEDEDRRLVMAETVCTEGSPNDGFLVGGLVQPLAVTTFPVDPPGPATSVVNTYDLTLGAGSFYLGGYRFTIDQAVPAETFQTQRDWLTHTIGTGVLPMAGDLTALPTIPNAARTDVVALMGYEQTVTSTEDQEFRERALGGVDTGVRVRRMRKIAVLQNATATTCAAARAELRGHLTAPRAGDTSGVAHAFDATGTELLSKARLTVTFANTGADSDPCKPRQVRGFIGAENQAIRVQCTAANQFIWGYDDAAPLYRVQIDPNDPTNHTLQFLTTPRDRAALPLQGQAVEILPWDALLANREKAAALTGFVSAIATSYDPERDTLALTAAVPQNLITWLANAASTPFENPLDPAGQRRFFYLRVWTGGPPQAFAPNVAMSLTDTGLVVTFSDFAIPGDYWVIAARPNTPDLVVPWRLLDHAPPSGPRLFFTALALVQWTAAAGVVTGTVQDCRERFRSLCRSNGCCRYIVGDGQESFGDFTSINAAINALPQPAGGEVCVLQGRYIEQVDLSNKTNIRVHGCGRDTVIVAPAAAPAAVTIANANGIEIRNLAIECADTLGVSVLNDSSEITLRELFIRARDRAAILAKVDANLVVEGCELIADPLVVDLGPGVTVGSEPLLYAAGDRMRIEMNRIAADAAGRSRRSAAGGIQIGGGSTHVEIRRNEIDSGNGDGILLGSIHFEPLANAGNPNFPGGSGNAGGATVTTTGWVYDPNNCVFVPGDPQDPTGPGGQLYPVSEGDLADVAIIDNRIGRMGRNGISVARLFFPDEAPDLIFVERLLIAENTIRECMMLEVGPISPANIHRVAFGGIVLGGVEIASLRDNVIEQVGSEHRDQICGVFVRYAIGIAIEENRLRGNGQVANEGQPLKLGYRGGIYILFARAPVESVTFEILGFEFSGQRQDGMPAASIHGNVVVAREGRALYVVALGAVTVTDNQFTAHGSDFLALLFFVISALIAASNKTGPTSAAAQLPPDQSLGDVLLDALGGTAILVFNIGFSMELYLQLLGLAAPLPVPGSASDDTRWFIGGNIQFSDNQVVYDTLNPVFTLSLCAVLLFTFDDVVMNANQIECDMAVDFVIVDTFVAAFSTNIVGNRFKEGYLNAFLSAFTWGVFLNATALNVGTHCIIHKGLLEPAAVAGTLPANVRLNIALADPNGDSRDCNVFDQPRHDPGKNWVNPSFDAGYVPVQTYGG